MLNVLYFVKQWGQCGGIGWCMSHVIDIQYSYHSALFVQLALHPVHPVRFALR